MFCPSHRMLPKMTPVSIDETLMVGLMLWKPWGAMVYTAGRSTILRSPRVAKSKQRSARCCLSDWRAKHLKSTVKRRNDDVSKWQTKKNIETMHLDVSLRIDGVRDTTAKVRHKVLLDFTGASRPADILIILILIIGLGSIRKIQRNVHRWHRPPSSWKTGGKSTDRQLGLQHPSLSRTPSSKQHVSITNFL